MAARNEVLVGIQLSFSTASVSYLLPGKNVDPTLVDGYPGSRNFKSGIVPFRVRYDTESGATAAWGHDNSDKAMREQLLLKTGSIDLKLKADRDILCNLGESDSEETVNNSRHWTAHVQAFLSKLITHVIKRGKVTFGALGDVTYNVAVAVPPWWYGEVQPSSLLQSDLQNEVNIKIELLPEPVCCLAYFFSREKKHMLSSTGAKSLVVHCSMDDRYTTVTSTTIRAKGASRDVQLRHVQIHSLSTLEVSRTFQELLEKRVENALDGIDEDVPSINAKIEKLVDDFCKFLTRFDGTKDCKLRLPWKLPDCVDLGIRNNQITFEASILREKLFKKLLLPLCNHLVQTAETESTQIYVLCSGALSECPYIKICLETLLEEHTSDRNAEVLSTLNGQTSAARGAAIFLDSGRQHIEITQIEPSSENNDVIITMPSAFDDIEGRIHALLIGAAGVLPVREAVMFTFKAEALIKEHTERFKCTPVLLQLFARAYSVFAYLKKDCIALRRKFDAAVIEQYASDEAAKEKDLDVAFFFYKYGATPELLRFLTATGSQVSGIARTDLTGFFRPIHVAVWYSQLPVVEWLLSNNAEMGGRTSDNSTCLHIAVRRLVLTPTDCGSSVFEFLLAVVVAEGTSKTGILNAENSSGETALDIAIEGNLDQECNLLRAAGAQENSKWIALREAIVLAIGSNDQEYLEKALKEDPAICNKMQLSDGMTLLHLAVKQQKLKCAHSLLHHCERVIEFVEAQDSGGWSALHLAVALDDLPITTLLLLYGADLEASSSDGYGWLIKEAAGGVTTSSVELSKIPHERKGGGWRPLHIASILGSETIARLLVEAGAQLHPEDLEGITPIRRAISNNHTRIVQIILDHMPISETGVIHRSTLPDAGSPLTVLQPSHGALTESILMENQEIIDLLLKSGWDVNEQAPQSGWTALSQAVILQNEALVTRLLDSGADPKILHSDGSSLLHLAVEGKNIQLVRLLLPHCPVLATDQHGATALHSVARKGYSPAARLLLNSGMDVNAVDHKHRTALYVAVESSNLPVAQLLLDSGASIQSVGGPQKTLLHAAVYSGNIWALKLALSQKEMKNIPLDSVDGGGDTLLGIAAKGGNVKMVQDLLRLHKSRNLWRPILQTLFAMAETGNDAMLKVIMHHERIFLSALCEDAGVVQIARIGGIGAVSKSSWTVLHSAVWHAQPSSVEVLINGGAGLHAEAASLTPLGLLCVIPRDQLQAGHLKACKVLLNKGADVSRGGLGHSPLHLAAIAGHVDLLEPLLSGGAVLSATNGQRQTALQCAVESGHTVLVSKLVEKGATLDPISVHTAVHAGRLETVQMLTDMGFDVDFEAPDGFTPLLIASAMGRIEMINHFLANGVNIKFRTANRGQSALDMAVASRQLGSVTALLDSPLYSKTFRSDRSYAWAAAGKDTSSDGKLYKYIFDRTDCQKDQGAAILHWAVMNDNESLLHLLANNGVDLKTPSLEGWSALHTAAMAGKTDMIRLVLNKGVGVNYQGHKLRTALHQAIAADQPEAISFLLQNGADVAILDEDSQGCIHIALDHSATNALQALNLQPSHFTANSYGGKTLVALAAESDNSLILRCLLTIEAGFGSDYRGSLQQAVGAGDTALVQKLLGCGSDLNRKDAEGCSPLREAVSKQNQTIAALLLDSGANVESTCSLGVTPLAFAAKSNDVAMAELLISHGANINATEIKNKCPILVGVAWRGHLDMIKLLLRQGCDVQCQISDGSTALHQATLQKHGEVIKVLVQGGLFVDTKDGDGHTALYLTTEYHSDAAILEILLMLGATKEQRSNTGSTALLNATVKNKLIIMKALLKHGADINNADETGRTPIMAAVAAGSESCVQLLLDHGARLDLVNRKDLSLLHYAANSRRFDIINILLVHGSDINSGIDEKKCTLLHRAAKEGRLDFVKYLLDAGAELKVKNVDGENALMMACRGKESVHVEVARFLIEAGQDCNDISPGSRRTALLNAVGEGNIEMTNMLVEKGAKVTLSVPGGQSLLHEAAGSGNVSLLDLLLGHGLSLVTVDDGPSKESVLFRAADCGKEETVLSIAMRAPELIDKPNDGGETPVQRAVLKQHLGVTRLLCDLGAMVSQVKKGTHETLMHLAAKTGTTASTGELIEYLSQCGVSVYSLTNDGTTPLIMAVMHSAAEAVMALIACGAKVDEFVLAGGRGRALGVAVANELPSMVHLLVSRGASLTFLDGRGNPILDTAVASNNTDVVRIILRGEGGNSSINGVSSEDGMGPVHRAVMKNNGNIITLLLQYGARGNLRNGDGRTPLQMAAALGHGAAAEALYQSGKVLDTDARANGDTAMMMAARRGDSDFIRNLMAHHEHLAKPSAQWDESASAAAESGHFEVVQLFIDMRDTLGWQE